MQRILIGDPLTITIKAANRLESSDWDQEPISLRRLIASYKERVDTYGDDQNDGILLPTSIDRASPFLIDCYEAMPEEFMNNSRIVEVPEGIQWTIVCHGDSVEETVVENHRVWF